MRFALVLSLCLMLPRAVAAADVLWLPPPLDAQAALIGRYADWLTAEAGAPAGLGWPPVTIEPLPRAVRMAFVFPTPQAPGQQMRIILSPHSIDRAAGGQMLAVLGELAHELSHYVLLMAENGWQTDRQVFVNTVHHHCDPEFQRLSAGMGPVIWRTYHSADAVRAIDHMVGLACWRDGHDLSTWRP
jgi:hypothetical protein